MLRQLQRSSQSSKCLTLLSLTSPRRPSANGSRRRQPRRRLRTQSLLWTGGSTRESSQIQSTTSGSIPRQLTIRPFGMARSRTRNTSSTSPRTPLWRARSWTMFSRKFKSSWPTIDIQTTRTMRSSTSMLSAWRRETWATMMRKVSIMVIRPWNLNRESGGSRIRLGHAAWDTSMKRESTTVTKP